MRDWVEVLAVTANVTTPLLVPLAPLEIDNHVGLLLAAVQAQPLGAVTLVVLLPAADVIARDVGEIENEQPSGACVSVNTWPAIATVPTLSVVCELAVMLYDTVPLPDPLAPPVTVIHDVLLCAVQAQPLGAVTLVVLLPAADVIARDVGEIENEQASGACVSVNTWPAIATVPTLSVVCELAVMLYDTVPLPDPLAPPVTVIHDVLLCAVQAQPLGAVTLVVLLPAADVIARDVGEIENEQASGACVSVNTWPAIATVPTLSVVCELAVMLYDTVPLPDPLAPPVTVIHDVLLCAVQAQPAPAVTDTVALPAVWAAVRDTGAIAGVHGGGANENWFDGLLSAAPPGPVAVTRAS